MCPIRNVTFPNRNTVLNTLRSRFYSFHNFATPSVVQILCCETSGSFILSSQVGPLCLRSNSFGNMDVCDSQSFITSPALHSAEAAGSPEDKLNFTDSYQRACGRDPSDTPALMQFCWDGSGCALRPCDPERPQDEFWLTFNARCNPVEESHSLSEVLAAL